MKPTLFQFLLFFYTKMFRAKHFETKKPRKQGKPEKPAYKIGQAGSAMKPTSSVFKMFVAKHFV